MAKRKRNQQATPAKNQNAASTPSKKPKIVNETPRNAGPRDAPASGKSTIAPSDVKRQSTSTTSKPASTEVTGAPRPVQSSSSLKRKRHRKRLRELKKNALSASKAEDHKPSTVSEQKALPQELPVAPARDMLKDMFQSAVKDMLQSTVKDMFHSTVKDMFQSTAVLPEKNSAKSKARQGKNHSNADSSKKPTKTNKSQSSDVAPSSKHQHDIHSNNKATDGLPIAHATRKPEGEHGDVSERRSKKKLRRQSAFRAKQAAASMNGQQGVASLARSNADLSSQARSRPSNSGAPKPAATSSDAALLHQATKTHLLPRPVKQWVEQDDVEYDDGTTANDASTNHGAGNSILDPLADALRGSPARPSPNQKKSTSLPQKTSIGPVLPGFLATVGVPSTNQTPPSVSTPPTRPDINTIAPRRRSARILAQQRPISGLSGIRMDTGMIGSSPKPVSANKANSVPSYAGRGDVQAAFKRFDKFAHGGNSSDSDDDDDDSDDSDDSSSSRRTAETIYCASADAIFKRVKVANPRVKVPNTDGNGLGVNRYGEYIKYQRVASMSDRSIEVSNTHENALAQPINNAPRMLGERDLPLFSDFNAKHNIKSADTTVERSERELAPSPSGFGQTDDAELPFIDYVASQDADDVYRSIEDISREVFGSIRELPDCKPLSNSLDVATERFITDKTSNHGLGRQPAEPEVPLGKTTVLGNIVRKSSPIVYIPNEMEFGTSSVKDGDEERDEVNEEAQSADDEPSDATQDAALERQSGIPSSLSTLTPSPTPSETECQDTAADARNNEIDVDNETNQHFSNSNNMTHATEVKKRKLTGTTSKHFSPRKKLPRAASARIGPASQYAEDAVTYDSDEVEPPVFSHALSEEPQLIKHKKKKGTSKTSNYFTSTSSPAKPTDTKKISPLTKTPRPPKGTSTCPVPSTNSTYFGLIQEKLWKEPFWLIIAVTFLNKTTGRAAAPIFWNLKKLYPSPEALSQAEEKDLVEMIGTLGLQNQRAKRLILIAKAWLANPPAKNQLYRTLHYPAKGDGKGIKKDQVVEEDVDECEGALEIGHIPGCGPYAWDSWRIFCRDVQRGLAQDYNGRRSGVEDFEPEWQRVVPLDKELRACLRWMWLREGYVWDHETGERRDASLDEMVAGLKGEMYIIDEQERKFAIEAAGVGGDGAERVGAVAKESVSNAVPSKKAAKARPRKMSIARRELDVESGDEVAVPTVRRSRKNKGW